MGSGERRDGVLAQEVLARGALALGIILLLVLVAGTALLGTVRATAVSQADEGRGVEDQAEQVHLVIQQTPRLQQIIAGDDVTFNVTINNTGNVTLEKISVGNNVATDCNKNNVGPLEPGAQTSYSCEVHNIDDSFLNIITAAGETSNRNAATVTKQTDAFVKVLKSDIRILKRPTAQTVTRGAIARFTIAILNTEPPGGEILTNVKITDPLVPDCTYDEPIPVNLGPGESFDYSCNAPNVQAAFTSVATASAKVLGSGENTSASDVGWVELLDLQATISSTPPTVPEPGDLVTFTITVNNPGSIPLTLQALNTNQFGNVMNPANQQIAPEDNSCLPSPSLPLLAPAGGVFECSFVATVSGQPSDFSVILTAVAEDDRGEDVSATTNTTVVITNVPSSMSVSVTADPPLLPAPSGTISYSVRLVNTSEVDAIQVNTLRDSILDDLDGQGSCNMPTLSIAAGSFYQCAFTDVLSGTVGDVITRTITATGIDDDLTPNQVSGRHDIGVSIIDRPVERIFLANIADDVDEPNNTCIQAYPLQLNRPYNFLAEDIQDIYSFTLTDTQSISVELTNFVPRAGQLIVWKGECGMLETPPVGRNPDTSLTKTVELGSQPPGPYIIQIINDGPLNDQDLYGLIVRLAPPS